MRKLIKNNQEGLTLIEVIISLAILGIMIVAYLTVFTSGFTGIMRAGHRAEAAYDAQQEQTQKIMESSTFVGNDDITLNFDGGTSVTLDVSFMESSVDVNGNTSVMKSFVPTPSP